MPTSDHRTPRAEAPSSAAGPEGRSPPIEAVIVGGNDETRLLLRGLLRLHRYLVRSETRSAGALEPSDGLVRHRVLILVTEGEGDAWPLELASARDRQPGLLPLLLVPETSPSLEMRARAAGVRGILQRPFAIRDLVASVEAIGRGEERFPPSGEQR